MFGPNKLIDLVMLMGNYAGTAALLTTVDMQLHTGKKPLLPIPWENDSSWPALCRPSR